MQTTFHSLTRLLNSNHFPMSSGPRSSSPIAMKSVMMLRAGGTHTSRGHDLAHRTGGLEAALSAPALRGIR
jgi:hypothetical protein